MTTQRNNPEVLKTTTELGFTNNYELYDYMVESYINGNFSQCKGLFGELPIDNKHELIAHIRDNHANDEMHNYFVKLFSY